MRVEIPMLPPAELNPNYHGHWRVKARAASNLRRAAYLYARNAKGFVALSMNKAEVSITFVIRDRRSYKDPDNALASLKPAIDGCVDAGVIPDDSDEHLLIKLPVMYEINKDRAPMTILEFEEV